MTKAELNDYITSVHGDDSGILLADGFEDAFLGVATQFNKPPVAVYDMGKCIEILMCRDGMSEEDALEFFDFNVQGAWVGAQTPMFVVRGPREVLSASTREYLTTIATFLDKQCNDLPHAGDIVAGAHADLLRKLL